MSRFTISIINEKNEAEQVISLTSSFTLSRREKMISLGPIQRGEDDTGPKLTFSTNRRRDVALEAIRCALIAGKPGIDLHPSQLVE